MSQDHLKTRDLKDTSNNINKFNKFHTLEISDLNMNKIVTNLKVQDEFPELKKSKTSSLSLERNHHNI